MENFNLKAIFFKKNSLNKTSPVDEKNKHLFFNNLTKKLTSIMFILRSNANESEGGGWTTPDNKGVFHTRAGQIGRAHV